METNTGGGGGGTNAHYKGKVVSISRIINVLRSDSIIKTVILYYFGLPNYLALARTNLLCSVVAIRGRANSLFFQRTVSSLQM
jgi:hypothetical protein